MMKIKKNADVKKLYFIYILLLFNPLSPLLPEVFESKYVNVFLDSLIYFKGLIRMLCMLYIKNFFVNKYI